MILKSVPKLLSPINSLEGAVKVINAGADEIYCGVIIPEFKDFVLYRGRVCEVRTYQELGKIVEYAHKRNIKVFLTINTPFIVDDMEKSVKKHINYCIDKGVDGLIVGNVGVLSLIKEMQVDIPLIASTFFAAMNIEAVKFFKREGFMRIILERHLTIDEISEIAKSNDVKDVEIEIFIHNGGCSNINGSCYLLHIYYPKLLKVSRGLAPCKLLFDVYDANKQKKIGSNLPVLNAYSFCSLCQLPQLIRSGVSGFKIEGRCSPPELIASITMIYRKLIDTLKKGSIQDFQKKLASIKVREDPLAINNLGLAELPLNKRGECNPKYCYYRPFFEYRLRANIKRHVL